MIAYSYSESILLLGKTYHSFIYSFTIGDDLILPKKDTHSVKDTQIAEVTNKNMNQIISDSNASRILIYPLKDSTPKRTTVAVFRELLNE